MSFNPLISLARNAKRQRMEMQCDPQWVLDLADERDQLRAERDSHQRLCIAEMEKSSQLRAELEAIRGQQPDAVSVPRELLEKLLHAEVECLHGQLEEALESLRALSTKNAEEV